jgi:hypothetical protein
VFSLICKESSNCNEAKTRASVMELLKQKRIQAEFINDEIIRKV